MRLGQLDIVRAAVEGQLRDPECQALFLRIILGNEIVGLRHEGKPFLTLKGILKYGAKNGFVTVDMGAVRFVTNGADVMGPGITDADPAIKTGDLVWIREERHGKPLAIGVALADAATLRAKAKGKQVRTLYVVGDKVWKWGEAEEEAEEEEDDEGAAQESEEDEADSEDVDDEEE